MDFLSKTNMNRLLLLTISLLACLGCYAQSRTFKGRVLDTDSVALPYANVVILSMPDSAFVQGAVTDDNGEFSINAGSASGQLLFRISMIGYNTAYRQPSQTGTIVLTAATNQLGEVVVRGQSAFSMKGSNVVANISGTSLSTEDNITDLLGKLPGFYTQGGRMVPINSGSVKYYINNRPVTEAEFNRINIKTVKSVEIDQHPGSRFAGDVGTVVYINTHKFSEGLTAFARSFTQLNHKFTQGFFGEIRYQYKKLSIALGGDYTVYNWKPHHENGFEWLGSDRKWSTVTKDNLKLYRETERMYSATIGYEFSDNHKLTIAYIRRPNKNSYHPVGTLSVVDGDEETIEPFESRSKEKDNQENVNLYYTGTISDRWSVDVAADWYERNNRDRQDIREQSRNTRITTRANSTLLGLSPRAMYKGKSLRAEFGADWSRSKIHDWSELNISDIRSTDNRTRETKSAAYASLDWTSPGKAWSVSLGLRYENTSRHYRDENGVEDPLNRTYQTWLPTVSLSHTSTKNWTHRLNYNSGIEYPSFDQIAGGDSYSNRFLYNTSNPKIEQAVSHSFSYDMSYQWFYLTASYTYTYRPIQDVFYREDYNGGYRIRITTDNISSMHGVRVVANAAPRFGIYEPRLSLGYVQNFMTLPGTDGEPSQHIHKPFAIASLNNSLSLRHNWTFNLDFSYRGAGSNGFVRYGSTTSLNFRVQKQFFDRSLRVTFRVQDILDKSSAWIRGNINGVAINSFSWMDVRRATLNITWYFNKYRSSSKHSSISSETNRL